MDKKAPIFVALDTPNLNEAITIASDIKSFVTGIKIGSIFFYRLNKNFTENKISDNY